MTQLPSHWNNPTAVVEIVKAVALLVVIAFLLGNWVELRHWISSATHFEFAGLKIDKKAVNTALINLPAKPKDSHQAKSAEDQGNPIVDAVARQEIATLGFQFRAALNGAKVLWVDSNPGNTKGEQELFELYGIKIQRALATQDALNLLANGRRFDLLITNAFRPDDKFPDKPLTACPIVLAERPDENQWQQQHKPAMAAFNAEPNTHPLVGFALIQEVHNRAPDMPAIMYSSTFGAIAGGRCMQATNMTSEFIRQVFLGLAKSRWAAFEQALSDAN